MRGLSADDLAAIKSGLVDAWDNPALEDAIPGRGEVWLQADQIPRPPRGGFAVGHSQDAKGNVRLELRVSAQGGPNLQKALRIQHAAEMQGLPTMLRTLSSRVLIPFSAAHPAVAAPVIGGIRKPLHIGVSVAHEESSAGTLSAFVTTQGGLKGILSCAHVLAYRPRGKVRKGDPIQQPGLPEPVKGVGRIGELTEFFAPFVAAGRNNLDAAIAALNDDVDRIGNVLPHLDFIPEEFRGRPLGAPLLDPPRETRVFRVGRTSGFGRGEVLALDLENVRARLTGHKAYTFNGVYEVGWNEGQPPTRGGDSGALVIAEDGLRPIGLHFSSSALGDGPSVSYVVPWKRIAEEFAIQLS